MELYPTPFPAYRDQEMPDCVEYRLISIRATKSTSPYSICASTEMKHILTFGSLPRSSSMIEPPHELAEKIYQLAARLPDALVETLTVRLLEEKTGSPGANSTRIVDAIPNPAIQAQLEELLDVWQSRHPEINASGIALALLTASHAENQHRIAQALELVWTGPRSQHIPLRRTDQALLQLIQEAKERLLIVSFAVYKAKNILNALVQAAQRGVAVSILVESPEDSADKISYDPVQALGEDIRKHTRIYVWPKEKRALSPDGKHGSLHAKAAIADGRTLLISSANLTEYAMNLNMELGVLIQGGTLPGQVEGHFEELMRNGTLLEIKSFEEDRIHEKR